MSEELTREVIMRALASLRERNIVPSVDLPAVIFIPLEDEPGYQTRIAIDLAEAAAAADIPDVSAERLATSLATYLDEVVNVVPAYETIARVINAGGGVIRIYLRAE
ncbi:MAG: hypothetical protein KGO05_08750 [Chloroflexota bacterium]|nr:hypothetical protein [Chloroflexota bacterium]